LKEFPAINFPEGGGKGGQKGKESSQENSEEREKVREQKDQNNFEITTFRLRRRRW